MKRRPAYKDAIFWLAMNDDHDPETPADVARLTTTILVADLFGRLAITVGRDVLKIRNKQRPGLTVPGLESSD